MIEFDSSRYQIFVISLICISTEIPAYNGSLPLFLFLKTFFSCIYKSEPLASNSAQASTQTFMLIHHYLTIYHHPSTFPHPANSAPCHFPQSHSSNAILDICLMSMLRVPHRSELLVTLGSLEGLPSLSLYTGALANITN